MPPPDLIDGEEEYEVEEILQSRRFGRGRKVQYLVKWKGYPESDNQWVDWDDLHADEMIVEFKKKNPAAASHIKAARSQTEFDHQIPMSDNEHSSPPLTVISPADMPPEVRQLFLDWRPTVPSSWTTPPESDCYDLSFILSPYYTQIRRTASFLLSPHPLTGLLYFYDLILLPPALYDMHLVLRYDLSCTIHLYEPLIRLLVVLGEFRFPST